nr:MAG TPA: DNA-directed RNA polymerase subunit [Caudoviricetes sp.]
MTIQEALKIFENVRPQGNKIINEALRTVESAVGKQIPRKPDIWGDGVDDDGDLIYDSWACPCCHEEYELGYDDYEYCPNCGQAIDWRENNG